MNVILLDNVENLGSIGDMVTVKPGYGRNYLLPSGKAALATRENVAEFEARRAELEKKLATTAGDQVLKAVGEHLHGSIRDVDCVGRYGGEEFILLLPETDKDAARRLSERLRKGIAAMNTDDLPNTTISMGIATFPEDGTNADELLLRADAALYEAKKKGRNRVVGYTETIPLPDVNPDAAEI